MIVEDLFPSSHVGLRLLRIFLPWKLGDENKNWSELLRTGSQLCADSHWFELASSHLTSEDYARAEAPSGRLPSKISEDLHNILAQFSPAQLRSFKWDGYASCPSNQPDGFESGFGWNSRTPVADAFLPDEYPASRLYDVEGTFALATIPYPDSIFVAAAPDLFRSFHQAHQFEVVTVRATDRVAPSASD